MHSKITISLHDILLPKIPQVSIKKDKTTKHPPPSKPKPPQARRKTKKTTPTQSTICRKTLQVLGQF